MDLYTILDLPRNATKDDVKKAYRKKARKVHPDTSKHKDGKAFCALQKAFSILSDDDRRKRYDETGSTEEKKSPEEACKITLMQMAVELVGSCPDHRIDNIDVRAEMIRRLRAAKNTAEKNNETLGKGIAKFNKAAKRFLRKHKTKEPNFMADACAQKALQLGDEIKKNKDALKLIDISLSLLDDFAYEFDNPAPMDRNDYISRLMDSLMEHIPNPSAYGTSPH